MNVRIKLPPQVAAIYRATAEAFKDADIRSKFEPNGTVLVGSTPKEFADVINSDLVKWAKVLKSAGMLSQ